MSKTELSSRSESSSQPLLTVQISQRAGWMLLAALALVAALVIADIRSGQAQPPVSAPVAARVESPAPALVIPTGEKVAARPVAESKPVADPSVEVSSSSVSVGREAPPATVIVRQPAAIVSQTEVSSVSIVPAAAPVGPITGPVSLNGAGATFPFPLYAKWFSAFHDINPNIELRYQAIGSGGGIRQIVAGTVDFGASDGFMTDEELSQTPTTILQIPTVLGAVVPIFNIPGVNKMRFTPEILAGIYLGKITSWNHPAIAKVNPHMYLPDQPIIVVHRSDGNSSTFTFTDYLSKVSGEWQSTVGKGTSVKWPIGLGGKGNEGVAGQVRQLDGAIGYVDFIYALQNRIGFGSVRNSSGRFVTANLDNVTEAAASVPMPADFRVSITNAPGKDSYPISSFTWLLVPQRLHDADRTRAMKSFLRWMIYDGEATAKELGYAPLPPNVASQVKRNIGVR